MNTTRRRCTRATHTLDRQVWVGYFDEGIYGNYGWGRAESEEPVGAYGIVRFSSDLESA